VELTKAFRAEAEGLLNKYENERISIAKARRKLKRSGKVSITWQDVVELAHAEYGLPMMGTKTLQRIRRLCGADLPDRTRGPAKKGGHNSRKRLSL
jgi:hypothetical protein